MARVGSSLLVIATVIGGMSGALAQTDDAIKPDQPQQATPVKPDDGAPTGTDLSRKLARTRGVIEPPTTNDHAVKPPPDEGKSSMPVVKVSFFSSSSVESTFLP